MLPLVVHVERAQGGHIMTRAFHESPVRIGRSPFASLRLREPFVSEWHAVVRFHDERTTYLDLGSRNPTRVRGQAVERNIEVAVDAHTDVRIGDLRLRFERVEVGQDVLAPALEEEDTSFTPEGLGAGDHVTGTIALNMLDHTALQHACAKPSATPPPLPQHADTRIAAAEHAFEAARAGWLSTITQVLAAEPETQAAERIHDLTRRHPRLLEEPEFRAAAHKAGVDPIELGHVDMVDWLTRLRGSASPPPSTEPVAQTMERVGQLLELFANAFIESRRAHQRARKKLGLELGPSSSSVLQRSEDPHVLLAYLLEPTRLSRARSHELRRTLGDFAMHQIALLSAVVEGARSMLTQLAPAALNEAPDSMDAAAVLDHHEHSGSVWPFAARKLWRRFVVRHHDLLQTDHFARELFGREFTRRYHAIADSSCELATGSP